MKTGTLAASLTEYSREAARVDAWRDRLATLIETSQGRAVNPWVRGFGLQRQGGGNDTRNR